MMFRRIMSLLPAVVLVGVVAPVHAADIERDPIHYSTAPVHNAISHLQQSLASDETSLPYDEHFGYLPGLLSALKIPAASQMLVFSKTSMQRQCITARTPRAVYFNDDNYVGYCQDGAVLEILSVDPQLGPVFYTLDQEKTAQQDFSEPMAIRENLAEAILLITKTWRKVGSLHLLETMENREKVEGASRQRFGRQAVRTELDRIR